MDPERMVRRPGHEPAAPAGDHLPAVPAESRMAARAEWAIAFAVLAVRVIFAVQLILSLAGGAARSDRPVVFVTLALAMVTESVVLVVVLLRRRAITCAMAVLDVGFVVVMISTEPLYSTADDRVGTWVAWGFGAGAAAAMSAGGGLPRLRHAAMGGVALVVAYLLVSLPAAAHTGMASTALTNSVALIGFAVGTWVVARFIRDLAGAADDARAEAAELAHRSAVERQRLLLHDQATVLSLLSQPELAEELESVLREQASRGSRQIRAFLARENVPAVGANVAGDSVSLAAVLRAVADEFTDLPLTVNVDLAVGMRVPDEAAHALAAGVRTLLHNVRRHARARAVTLHADRLPDGCWEVTVQDDGVGFDPAGSSGFGLRVQAGSALREAGMRVAVDSAPGEGTKATIVGPCAGAGS